MLAIVAYTLWSTATIYFKALDYVSAIEVLSHRVIWSFLLTLIIVYFFGLREKMKAVIANRRLLLGLLVSTVLIAMNWGVFIWAVQNDKILSASLGYYINPLVSIMLGMVFLAERLNFAGKIAAGLCVAAVIFELISFGRLPWIALFLAFSFGLYGLVRKKLAVDSFVGLVFETGFLLPFALVYLWLTPNPAATFGGTSWQQDVLLILAGPVTTIPLVCFAAAANRISLSAMGFIQYISPSGMFFLAIFIYGEDVTPYKLITFFIIWVALSLLIANSIRHTLRSRRYKKARVVAPLS